MSFDFFRKALRQLLLGESMKKAKATENNMKSKTAKKPVKPVKLIKVALKKSAEKPENKPMKLAEKKAPKQVAKPASKAMLQATPQIAAKPVAKTAAGKVGSLASQIVASKEVNEIATRAKSALKKAVDSVKAVNKALAQKVKTTEATIEAAPRKILTLKDALAGAIKPARELEPDVITRMEKDPSEITDHERKSLLRKLSQAGNNYDSVYKIAKTIKAKPYKMTEIFEAKTPIQHKILGWGFILAAENNRIQVLFKDGVRTLIMNYQR